MDSPKNSSDNTGFSTAHALVVAIAAYTTVTPLPVAVINDARDITSVLTSQSHCGYAPNNVRMLLDGEATLEALRHELDALAERSGVDDTVVIFFSGHGALIKSSGNEESGLVPIDCDPKHLSATVLSEAEFSAALARIKAQRLVVFIDACHSGGVSSFKGNGGPKPVDLGFSEKSLDRLVQGAGRVFIASSRASEVSRVLAGASNSLFTQHLLDALRGNGRTSGDGFVRIFEVFNYVSEKVRGAAPRLQHPIFKASDLEDNFPIALDRGGMKSVGLEIPVENRKELWRQFEDVLADLYPLGPIEQEIWARAGGDLSQLRLTGNGRANWFAALKSLRQGGGGAAIRLSTLVKAALEDFPHHQYLAHLSNIIFDDEKL